MSSTTLGPLYSQLCSNILGNATCGNCFLKLTDPRIIRVATLSNIIGIVYTLMHELPSNTAIIHLEESYTKCNGKVMINFRSIDDGTAHYRNIRECVSLLTLWNRTNATSLRDSESEIFTNLITYLYTSPSKYQASLLLQAMFNLANSTNDIDYSSDSDSDSDNESIYEDCQQYIHNLLSSHAAIATLTMTTISDVFKNVLVIEDTNEFISDDDVMNNEYFLHEAFNKTDVPLSTIIKWELQLARFIYSLHKRGSLPAAINIPALMVDSNLNIIGSSIQITAWNTNRPVEVGAVGAVSKTNDGLFKYILDKKLPGNKNYMVNLLYIFNTYYCAASIKVNGRYMLQSYIHSIEHFHNMVDCGFIDNINNLLTHSGNIGKSNNK